MRRGAVVALSALFCAGAGAMSAAVLAASTPLGALTTGTTETTTPTETRTVAAEVIPPDVSIANVEVGGMTPSEAEALVAAQFARPVVLRFRRRAFRPEPSRLGATARVRRAVERARVASPGAQVPLGVVVRTKRLRRYLGALAKRLDRRPVDSRLFLRGVRPWLTKERFGRTLRRRAAMLKILGALEHHLRGPIRLRMKRLRPAVTRRNFGPVIVIRRGSNRLYVYDGMRPWRRFGVATGQSVYPTPLGSFQIVVKWRNPWWYPPNSDWARGLSPVAPGPGNPLGTRWMGLSAPGVGIHGTPNAASIGYSVSHGCIRMFIPEAEWLFNRVEIGTPVFIVSA